MSLSELSLPRGRDRGERNSSLSGHHCPPPDELSLPSYISIDIGGRGEIRWGEARANYITNLGTKRW